VSRIVYRIVLTNPPSAEDFKSYQELGKTAHRTNSDTERMMSGLSVYLSLGYARRMGKRFPWKGNCFVAELELSDDRDFTLEQTGENPKHYTLWCSGDVALASLRRVVSVKEDVEDV